MAYRSDRSDVSDLSDPNQYLGIRTEAGEAFLLRASMHLIAELDGIIFDFDGVLVDVGESIQLVHGEAARLFFEARGWVNCDDLVEPSDVDAFKLAGGFNSDWELAFAWLLLYLFKAERHHSEDGQFLKGISPTLKEFAAGLVGGLDSAVSAIRQSCSPEEWAAIESQWDCPMLQRLFQEVYSGDLCEEVYGFKAEIVTGAGLIHKDRPILDKRFLPPVKLGIATGRTYGETVVSRRLMGWEDVFPIEAIVSEDDGFLKPDPRVLALAVEKLGARRPIYVGDTPDDLLTAKRYNGTMPACMVLSGHGAGIREFFIAEKADVIADNVNAALLAIGQCIGGALCQEERRK